jgi:hypothetical protein
MSKSRFCLIACTVMLLSVGFHAQAQASPRTASRCVVSASTLWQDGPTPNLRVEAFSDGPTCAKSVSTIVVRTHTGAVVHNSSYVSEFVLPLSDARTTGDMRTALRHWIGTRGGRFDHAALPNWLATKTEPEPKEFGFIPAEGLSRTDYLAIKANRTPVFCYVQGIESLNCLVWRNNSLQPFGVQQFPG